MEVNQKQLAALLGISSRQVRNLKEQGLFEFVTGSGPDTGDTGKIIFLRYGGRQAGLCRYEENVRFRIRAL